MANIKTNVAFGVTHKGNVAYSTTIVADQAAIE